MSNNQTLLPELSCSCMHGQRSIFFITLLKVFLNKLPSIPQYRETLKLLSCLYYCWWTNWRHKQRQQRSETL